MIRRKTKGRLIHISQIRPIIEWTIRMPNRYRIIIIEELIEMGYLKKIKRNDYEILPLPINPPNDSLGNPLWT